MRGEHTPRIGAIHHSEINAPIVTREKKVKQNQKRKRTHKGYFPDTAISCNVIARPHTLAFHRSAAHKRRHNCLNAENISLTVLVAKAIVRGDDCDAARYQFHDGLHQRGGTIFDGRNGVQRLAIDDNSIGKDHSSPCKMCALERKPIQIPFILEHKYIEMCLPFGHGWRGSTKTQLIGLYVESHSVDECFGCVRTSLLVVWSERSGLGHLNGHHD